MRKLNTSDVFAFARIVRACGIREELKSIIKEVAGKEDFNVEEIGMDTVLAIMEALAEKKSEAAICEMLAGPFEMSAEEVRGLELPELAEYIRQLADENDLKSFFKFVSGIVTKKSLT